MTIHESIAQVRQEMAAAAARAGRDAAETELLIVSKTFPPEAIREAAAFPHRLFGESRVQEALEKIPLLPPALRWHFIGHLQSNKVRKILPLCEAFHSVHSVALARDLDRIAAELSLQPQIYLQVNIANDAAKSGFSPGTLRQSLEEILELKRLDVLGLMTIPSFSADPEKARPHFSGLRELRDALEREFAVRLPGLSMGMSGDFTVAIEEGSTIVRIGSRIFGSR